MTVGRGGEVPVGPVARRDDGRQRGGDPAGERVEPEAGMREAVEAGTQREREGPLVVQPGRGDAPAELGLEPLVVQQERGRAQELEGAQRGVADHVHQRERVPADPDLDEDQTDLRDRGVGEAALGVGLGAADQRAGEGAHQTDADDGGADERGALPERRGAQQEVRAGVHRERAVEDGRRGRGAFHRARQPPGEGELRALAERSEEQQQPEDRGAGRGGRGREGVGERAAAEHVVEHHETGEERGVAQAVDREGEQTVAHRAAALAVERDEQRGGDADDLPTHEEQVKALGDDQERESGREEHEQLEEPPRAAFTFEVTQAERADGAREHGGQHEVDERGRVDQQAEVEAVVLAARIADAEPMAEDVVDGSQASGREGLADEQGGGAEAGQGREREGQLREPREAAVVGQPPEHLERRDEPEGEERQDDHGGGQPRERGACVEGHRAASRSVLAPLAPVRSAKGRLSRRPR